MPIIVETAVNEKSSSPLIFTFVDYAGVGVNVANIATAKMTLTVKGTKAIINGRTRVEVKDNFNATGDFSFELTPLDNVFVSKAKGKNVEYHVATFEIVTIGANPITHNEELLIKVTSLEMINSDVFTGAVVSAQMKQISALTG